MKWVGLTALFVLIAAAMSVRATSPSPAASFPCPGGSEIEAAICADPALSADDARMADFYRTARAGALGMGSNQLAAQREWLRERDTSCANGAWKANAKSLRDCLALAYAHRLEELAIADLMARPEQSLVQIRRRSPQAAWLYQAVHDYVAIDVTKRRAEVVAADLGPIFATMDGEMRGRLRQLPNVDATTARMAAASDANFAGFFVVDSVFGSGDQGFQPKWPCAALARRPGLLVGLGSYFGGAIDGSVPSSDCPDTLPPTHAVTALSEAAYAAQPPCEGTIRFSTGRDYVELQDAVRLHRTEVWDTKNRTAIAVDAPADDDAVAWRRAHQPAIDRAQAALETYYVRYFAVEPVAARRDASSALDALVDGAFASCE